MSSARKLELAWLLILVAGCGEDGPPLDELPLRDALSADPAVIAAMPEEARQRLATRLEVARTNDGASDDADSVGAGDPRALVAQADAARARRGAEALIVGDISTGAARALVVGLDVPTGAATLPDLETESAGASITPLESRALQGGAGSVLRGLLAASSAHRLRRVVGWPIGAVAIGDTAYVSGAWLAALAPASADGGADAGAAASATTRSPTPRRRRRGRQRRWQWRMASRTAA